MGRQFASASSQKLSKSVTAGTITANPLTLACWFNTPTSISTMYLMAVTQNTQSAYMALLVSNTQLVAESNNSGATDAQVTTAYPLNAWTHAAAVFTSGSSQACFMNGKFKATSASKTPLGLDTVAVGYTPRTNNFFNGLIGEAGVWQAALTDAEVSLLAQGCPPPLVRPQSLVAYWPLRTPGTVWEFDANPFAPRRYDLTVTGATPASHPPIWTPPTPVQRRRRLVLAGSSLFTGSSSGGASFGGAVTAAVAYAPAPSGGVILGSRAADSAAYAPAPSGGAALGGGVTEVAGYTPGISGGVGAGGSAAAQVALAPVSAGGVALGGGVTGVTGHSPAGAGGLAAGGATPAATTYAPTASGGSAAGGSLAVAAAYAVPSAGGVTAGAAAAPSADYLVAASGGVAAGGASPQQLAYGPGTAVGVEAGGGSNPAWAAAAPAAGGPAFGGVVTVSAVSNSTATEGAGFHAPVFIAATGSLF